MAAIDDLKAAVTHVETAAAAAEPLVGHSPAADAAMADAATRVEAVAKALDGAVAAAGTTPVVTPPPAPTP